jgi:hypothetical protein
MIVAGGAGTAADSVGGLEVAFERGPPGKLIPPLRKRFGSRTTAC